MSKNEMRRVTRFEVIDSTGAHFQDDGQTLKVFVPERVGLIIGASDEGGE